MQKRLIFLLIIIGILITLSSLYLIYLFLCEDDWCFHYEWQKNRRDEKYEYNLKDSKQIGEKEVINFRKNYYLK